MSATRIWVDDVNSDGKLDLLVGDTVVLISPAEGLTAEDFKERFAEWQTAREAAEAELSSSTGDEEPRTEALERYRKLYRERDEFMKEQQAGFVWLYVQK